MTEEELRRAIENDDPIPELSILDGKIFQNGEWHFIADKNNSMFIHKISIINIENHITIKIFESNVIPRIGETIILTDPETNFDNAQYKILDVSYVIADNKFHNKFDQIRILVKRIN